MSTGGRECVPYAFQMRSSAAKWYANGTLLERYWNANGTVMERYWNACGKWYIFRKHVERIWAHLERISEKYTHILEHLKVP